MARGAGKLSFIVKYSPIPVSTTVPQVAQFSPLGGYTAVTTGDAPNIPVNPEFPVTSLSSVASIHITCRAFENYLYARGSLAVHNVAFALYNSEGQSEQLVTIAPVAVFSRAEDSNTTTAMTPDGNGDYIIPCARRGDVFEDTGVDVFMHFNMSDFEVESAAPTSLDLAEVCQCDLYSSLLFSSPSIYLNLTLSRCTGL